MREPLSVWEDATMMAAANYTGSHARAVSLTEALLEARHGPEWWLPGLREDYATGRIDLERFEAEIDRRLR